MAEVGAHSAPGGFYSALEQIRDARLALQQGSESGAARHVRDALSVVDQPATAAPPLLDVTGYRGATVIDGEGNVIGEVTRASVGSLEVALGGWRDVWGLFDFGAKKRVRVPPSSVA